MKLLPLPFLLLSVLFAVSSGGCATTPEQASAAIPAPQIDDAKYQVGEPNTVVIQGIYFKDKSDNAIDVVTSLNGRDWKPATKIYEGTGLRYRVQLPYGLEFPQVWVRVFGINRTYSQPYLVHI